jgi:hypothetical protein
MASRTGSLLERERHIADTAADAGMRTGAPDLGTGFDEVQRVTIVFSILGYGEHVRIEDDVFGGSPLFSKQLVRALADFTCA